MTALERVRKVIRWLIFIEYAESEREIAEKLGYTKSSLSQIVTEKVPLSDKFLKNLCLIHEDINDVWIMTGEGEMLKGDSQEGAVRPPVIDKEERLFAMIESQQETIKELSRLVAKLEAQLETAKKDAGCHHNAPADATDAGCAAAGSSKVG